MRVAFVGKGGSGKTTLASLYVRYLQQQHLTVLAIDADINQHLAFALDKSEMAPPPLGHEMTELKRILCGSAINGRTPETMIKTSLPHAASHRVRIAPNDPVLQHFAQQDGSLFFMRTGTPNASDIGVRCFHAKTGAVELVLNHLDDAPDEWAVVDMTAGADAFASGLFTRFDLTIAVVEPTLQSVGVFKQYQQQADGFGVVVKAVGNKIYTASDRAFLETHCGPALIGLMPQSDWIKRREQGDAQPFTALDKAIVSVLQRIYDTALDYPRDWQTYWDQAVQFHVQNARSWGNQSVGRDIADDIDIEFIKSFSQPAQPRRSA